MPEDQAFQMIETLLCVDLGGSEEARTFEPREGMRTVYLGLFTNVLSVKIDGVVVDPSEYHPALFGKRNTKPYNSLVFKKPPCGEIEVTAKWGAFGDYNGDPLPADLSSLLSHAEFWIMNKSKGDRKVKSKRVEDFHITYTDDSELDVFMQEHALTIRKYSMCDIPYILHGETCSHGRRICSVC